MVEVGDRVRLRSLGHLGTVAELMDTPNYGPIPLVSWNDSPDDLEPHGVEELEVISPEKAE